MKHGLPRIAYFSTKAERVNAFWTWVGHDTNDSLAYQKNLYFTKVDIPCNNHAADLALFLGQFCDNLQSLHVIVDIDGIPKGQAEIIRNIIIQYPEVQFLFDRTKKNKERENILELLFPDKEFEKDIRNRSDKDEVRKKWEDIKKKILTTLIEISREEYDNEDKYLLQRVLSGYDNTFDASNLRYAIKYYKYISLKVDHNRNFSKIQDSRETHLAVCVEEETRQNIVNSYALYANGYRVFPISTRQELEVINSVSEKDESISGEVIIIRDYDLQFEDEEGEPVDEIRAFKYCTITDIIEIKNNKGDRVAKCYNLYWNDFRDTFEKKKNRYWSNLTKKYRIYFVTKGVKHAEIKHPLEAKDVSFESDKKKMFLPGFLKPVCGIYSPFQEIKEVKSTYELSQYKEEESCYKIETSRKEHDHSTPLDIYEMVNFMIRRADSYFEQKKYILAALLAGEAIEIMNGFHHRLMIKAYYILAKAENAIAMDVVGINEEQLAEDAAFRVSKIEADITRFYRGYENISSKNVLVQIFSDCRRFCKNNEHFNSEDVFLRAIGHLKEGCPFSFLFRRKNNRFAEDVKERNTSNEKKAE